MSVVMNSTSMLPGSNPGVQGLQMFGLPYLQSALTRYRPEAEILFTIALYSSFLAKHITLSTTPKRARARGFPYPTLLVHILTSYALVARYHVRYAGMRTWPVPDTTDLVAFTIFSLTRIHLEAIKARPQPVAFRASIHTAILLQIGMFAASWLGGRDPALFRTSIKLFNWFAWFRLTVPALDVIEPRLKPMRNIGPKVEVAALVSMSISLWEAGYPYGVPLQIGLLSLLVMGERAVAGMVSRLVWPARSSRGMPSLSVLYANYLVISFQLP